MSIPRQQAVIPLTKKFVPFDGQRGEFLVGNLDAGWVSIFIQLGLNMDGQTTGTGAYRGRRLTNGSGTSANGMLPAERV